MKTIFIVAGETSGDRHAASLVQALKKKSPEITFLGLGGMHLKQAGVKLLFEIVDLAVIGFFEVLRNIGKFRKIFSYTISTIKKVKPACVILVDYPGFNLHLARELKRSGMRIIYYISPQVWAWNKSRVKLIKNYVDKMIVIFEFEKEFYKRFGIEAEFVGHPLLDSIEIDASGDAFLKSINLEKEKILIALLPGSRKKEIYVLLPLMLEAARIITKKISNAQFLIIKSNTLKEDAYFLHLLDKYKDLSLSQVEEAKIYDAIRASEFAIVASGTATLETALFSKPMLIIYKLSFLSWVFARLLIKIPYIGLVNVVANELIVPELIQFKARPSLIAKLALQYLSNKEKYQAYVSKLNAVKEKLGSPGASQRAAEIIAKEIGADKKS